MQPKNTRLAQLFHDAQLLETTAQVDAFLAEACADDEALRRRLEELLAAHRAGGTPGRRSDQDHSEGAGDVLGHYELVEPIGEGGFGVVWRAEQREPVQRRVALKLIKLGMDTRQVVARFGQERQALALMDHPNIARVLDAGAAPSGRPYFVMELVEGVPLLEYCDRERLDVRARLALFVDVCRAIQHAHHKGIIHRDVKPSNVLVPVVDGRPVPKVIDFGVAKATTVASGSSVLLTEQRQMLGTPAYMSPEQSEGSADIDTRTDVYSLGVLLYELLTGTTPLDLRELVSKGYSEMLRCIREVDSPPPSARVAQLGPSAESVAVARGVHMADLAPLLRGELDWIVMRSIEKDRRRRYDSAEEFARDVERYLAGEAVIAAPPSRSYRLGKFVRRNRAAVVAAAAVTLTLAVGASAFAWQAHVAARERDVALAAQRAEMLERERARSAAESEAAARLAAEHSAREAEAVSFFLSTMFDAANVRSLGRTATVAAVLDSASREIASGLADTPEVEAKLRRVLGATYASLGMADESTLHLERALELSRDLGREDTLDYARTLGHLASLHTQRRRHAEAAELMARVVGIAKRELGEDALETLPFRSDYANALARVGRTEEAEAELRATLAARRNSAEPKRRHTVVLLNSLAVLMHDAKRLEEAEALYREALELARELLGDDDLDTLTVLTNLGSMLRSTGRSEQAEPLLREGYAGMRRVFGPDSPRTADVAVVLARFLDATGRHGEALQLHEEAVRVLQSSTGRDATPEKRELADLLRRLGDGARAAGLMREVVEALTASRSSSDSEVLECRVALANALTSADRFDEATAEFRALVEDCPSALGPEHPTTLMAFNGYGLLLMRLGRFEEAAPIVRRALEIGERVDGYEHRNTVVAAHNLGVCLRETGALEEAEGVVRDALVRASKAYGAAHANYATMRVTLADCLARLQRREEALVEYEAALASLRTALGARHATVAANEVSLARLLLDGGDVSEAEVLLQGALPILTERYGAADRRSACARAELGRCGALAQQRAEGVALLRQAHAELVIARGEEHAETRRVARYLAELFERWSEAAPTEGHAATAQEWRARAAPSAQR